MFVYLFKALHPFFFRNHLSKKLLVFLTLQALQSSSLICFIFLPLAGIVDNKQSTVLLFDGLLVSIVFGSSLF